MAGRKHRFHLREPTVDTNRPITDGTVEVDGFELAFVGKSSEADAWDAGMRSLLRAGPTAEKRGRPR